MDLAADMIAVVHEMLARWNLKDATSFAELFADDADFTDVIGQTARGRSAIEAQHVFPFTHNMREAVLTADSVEVRALGADAAVAVLKWTTTNNLSLDGGPAPPRKGTMQIVAQRHGGVPRIVSVLNQDPLGLYAKQMAERAQQA